MNYRVCEALVLTKEDLGEKDALVYLYNPFLGRIAAKVQSARKITSKLNAHLEPGNLVTVQLVKKNNYQLTDALVDNHLPRSQPFIKFLDFIKLMTAEGLDDGGLWHLLLAGRADYRRALRVLGFDPRFAGCEKCGRPPVFFLITQTNFWCEKCADPQWPDLLKF